MACKAVSVFLEDDHGSLLQNSSECRVDFMFKSCISKRNILLYLESATSDLPYVTRLKVVFVLIAPSTTEDSCMLGLVPQRASESCAVGVSGSVKSSVLMCISDKTVLLSDGI